MWYDILMSLCDVERDAFEIFWPYASVTVHTMWWVVNGRLFILPLNISTGYFIATNCVGLDNFVGAKFSWQLHWIHMLRKSRWRGNTSLWTHTKPNTCASVLDGFCEFGNVILQFVYQKHENSSFSKQSSVSQNWNFAYHTYTMHRHTYLYTLHRGGIFHVFWDLSQSCACPV